MIKSINVFSFLHNCKQCFNLNKNIDLDKTVNIMHFNRQPEFVIKLCDKIVGRIKNNHFNFYNFKLYILTKYLLNETVNWRDIKIDDVYEISEKCTDKKYARDNIFIDSLLMKIKLGRSSLLTVNSNGNNILLDLILDGKISPIYYVLQYENPDDYFKDPKYDLSNKLTLINKRTETIKQILRR